jgi:plasmid stabilization system protein ParE
VKQLIIRSVAQTDISETLAWFVQQRGTRVGKDFLDSLDACLRSIRENPKMFAVLEEEVRRAPLQRFPYRVFYVEGSDYISVVAVLHSARDPSTWRDRL